MPTLIATAKASNANSYATTLEADAYHETRLHSETWMDADDDSKVAALIWATRMLDDEYSWLGQKLSSTQALRWPRSGVYDRDGWAVDANTIPTFLKNATAELARLLITSDRFGTLDSAQSGVKAVTAGSVSVEFDKLDRIEAIPDSISAMVGFYAEGSTSSGINVPLVRV